MKRLKENKAITLIALVITIIVLLILAGVAINMTLGNNGIFNRAKTATEQYTNAQEYEEEQIAKYTNQINSYVDGNRDNFSYTYSLNEQVVGTWIDGRPIYQKTWSELNVEVPYNSWIDVVSVPNIDLIIGCYATTSYGTNINGAGIEYEPDKTNGKIKAEYNVNINRRKIAYFTAQYVKTPDSTN